MAHVYALGAVKPWVKDAAYEVGDKFDISTIYGVGARAGVSDHPLGLATDFMVYKDRAKGDQVADYCKQHWGALSIKYIIWYQRIDEGTGFKPMEDRGGVTANHKDHVHVSYNNAASGPSYAGSVTPADQAKSSSDTATDSLKTAFSKLGSPEIWIRILEFLAGVVLILGTAWSVITSA